MTAAALARRSRMRVWSPNKAFAVGGVGFELSFVVNLLKALEISDEVVGQGQFKSQVVVLGAVLRMVLEIGFEMLDG